MTSSPPIEEHDPSAPPTVTEPATPAPVSRRAFLGIGALGVGAMTVPEKAAAALGISPQNLVEVPADKNLTTAQRATLTGRGNPTRSSGAALGNIGMPIGGICAGQVYLSGDGQLWLWDIDNPDGYRAGGASFEGPHYAQPLAIQSPFGNGFAVRVAGGGKTHTYRLDAKSFPKTTFVGQYPTGAVSYRADGIPVEIELEAFSPFVPTSVADSELPLVNLTYTVRNTSRSTVTATIAGWAENPTHLESRQSQPLHLTGAAFTGADGKGIQFSAKPDAITNPREDIVFEDWERTDYGPWKVEGTAFNAGPVTEAQTPDYFRRQGALNVTGQRFVTSHDFRGDPAHADDAKGKLTGPAFTINRKYLTIRVGGGSFTSGTGVQLIVDGKVVAFWAGRNAEPMMDKSREIGEYEGKKAHLEIVDANTGGWAHVNVDRILFTDKPPALPFDKLPDAGTFAITAYDKAAVAKPSLKSWAKVEDIFDAPAAPGEIDGTKGTIAGSVAVPIKLAPGQRQTVTFAVSWFFPKLSNFLGGIKDYAALRRHYSKKHTSAQEVAAHFGKNRSRLTKATREWVKTWYADSTLPHWFLERTFAPASTLATLTCFQFSNDRFYAEEGLYCCEGTCQHVWNYAQSVGRLFPELERTARDIGDLGAGFNTTTGQLGFRQESDLNWAADGQAGTILRIYREHQMSPDGRFLEKVWPRTKKATEFLINQDGATPNGILEGKQHNTLDQDWFGQIPWISGFYVAALRAAAAMATERGDRTFAEKCTKLAIAGSASLNTKLWNEKYGYFEQHVDPKHPEATNSNRGCFIDQLFGENYTEMLSLPPVFDQKKVHTALSTIYRNNFLPNPAEYARTKGIKGPRRNYNTEGEAGTIMCTWPYGGQQEAPGGSGNPVLVGYFDEVWTGQEYQLASHLIAAGLVTEGLAVTRAVYDRYTAAKRNPYNEIECSDHYTRAMSSHGAFLAACGYEYHGPKGHLGFAPKISPENFSAAFTVAEGWGRYHQRRTGHALTAGIELRYGRLRLNSISVEVSGSPRTAAVTMAKQRRTVSAKITRAGGKTTLTFPIPITLTAGDHLTIAVS